MLVFLGFVASLHSPVLVPLFHTVAASHVGKKRGGVAGTGIRFSTRFVPWWFEMQFQYLFVFFLF